MRVLVCGSRSWTHREPIQRRLAELPKGTLVIHGGATGADAIADSVARGLGFHVAIVRPLWDIHGRSAGHVRNGVMLDLQPDLVIAFTLGTSGTAGTLSRARKRGIPVEVFTDTERKAAAA